MNYSPDVWVVLKIVVPDTTIYKVLAGWYSSGLMGSDSWKINSGITKIEETDTAFNVYGHSGSMYVCYKHKEHLSGQTSRILEHAQEAAAKQDGTCEVVPIETITELFYE